MSEIDLIEFDDNHVASVRIEKSGGGFHRFPLEPGGDLDATLASVNEHLQSMGHEAISNDAELRAILEIEHTPEVIAAFKRWKTEIMVRVTT